MSTAVFRAKILRAYGFDTIGILLSRGEINQYTGNTPGNLTRRISVCGISEQCPYLEPESEVGLFSDDP